MTCKTLFRQSGRWYACEWPERPFDDNAVVYAGCRPCMIALGAHAMRASDEVFYAAAGGETVTVAMLYERSRAEHGLPPLPKEGDAS